MEPEQKPKDYDQEIVDKIPGPNNTLIDKIRKVRLRNVEINWNGEKKIVKLRKLSFGKRAEYSERFINVQILGEHERVNVSLKDMQIQALAMGIYEAPFPTDLDYITNELDGEVGEILYKEIEDFNKLTEAFKKKSDGLSSTEQTIQK